MKRSRRQSGFSLFEVVLCLTILAISSGMLLQLLEAARLGSIRARRETEAIMHAESILAELIAAETEPTAVSEQPVTEEDLQWTYSVTVEATEWETLSIVTVQVRHWNDADKLDADVSLTRFLYVPVASEESGELL